MMFGHKKESFIFNDSVDINSMVELTLLDSRATNKDVANLCNIAYKNRYLGVVVFSSQVKFAKNYILSKLDGALKVIAVVDFPFGKSSKSFKIAEAKKCFLDGADEVEVVVCMSDVLEEKYNDIKSELLRIVRCSKGRVVKAVLETSYLNREQLTKISRVLVKSKVDYIMTNTGFGQAGVTPEIVEVINSVCSNKCSVKASGGIISKQQANDLARMGAQRIGTSRVI